MHLKTFINAAMFVLSSILWTASVTYADSATLPATYEKTSRGYVVNTDRSIEALCEPGDVFVKGSCEGTNAMQPAPDDRGPAVYLNSAEMNTTDKLGWSCSVRVIHPAQIIRVESKVTCSKGPA